MLKWPTKQAAMRKRWANKKNNDSSSLSSSTPLAPPVYELHSHVTEHHGCKRNDDFYWLCDRSNRKVKQLLKAENKYMERFFTLADNTTPSSSSRSSIRRKLFREITSRIRSNDISLPSRERSYWYYSREVEHEEHPLLCRRPYCALHEININFANEVSALWESNPNALLPSYDDEEIYLDLNLLKEQLHLDHIDIGEIDISHDEQQLVLTVDWSSGKEVYAVLVMNIGHVDYAAWLEHHAHPLHRVWAERQHRAGQSIYGSPTRRSPLFAPVSNTSWRRKIVNSHNNDHHSECCENCNSLTCTNHSSKSNAARETETKDREYNDGNAAASVNCNNIDACQQCTESNNITMSNVRMVESNEKIEVNELKKFTTLSKMISNSRHLPLHDIVCVIDDIAIGDEVMWADDTHLLYFALDGKMRPYQLIYHTLSSQLMHQQEQQHNRYGAKEEADKLNNVNDNTNCFDCAANDLDMFDGTKCDCYESITLIEDEECGDDIICYEEDDEAFWLGGLTRTADEQFCMFTTSSSEKSESYVCPTTTLTKEEIHTNHNSGFVKSCQGCSSHKWREHVVQCQVNRPVLTHAPIVRTAAMNDSTIDSTTELISQNEHLIVARHEEQNNKEHNMEESLLHYINNKVEELKETWNKSGEMICFAPRQGGECQPFEYEIDHHDCLLAEKAHKSNSGAWVIVSNAHGCTNHAVFILPDEEVMSYSLQQFSTTINTSMNIVHDELHKRKIGNASSMSDVTDRRYSLTCSTQWQLLFTYDEAIKVEHVELFRNFLLITVRKQGNPTVLFCPVSLIHNWWHQQKQTSKSTADKHINAIPINYLTDLQDIVQNMPLRSSSSSSSSSSLSTHQIVNESIIFKIPSIDVTEVCKLTKVKEEKLQQEKQHNNKKHDKISTNCADDNLTLAFESIDLSEAHHHNQQQDSECKEKEYEIENRESQDERKIKKHSFSTSTSSSLQVTPHLSSLPYHVEAMGFTSNFHSCEFRILVTHMLEPLTYYHVSYSKPNVSVSEGDNNNNATALSVNAMSSNSCTHSGSEEDSDDDDNNRDAVLLVTRMCQEVVVSAPGEPAYNVQDYDGVVLWVPSNYAFEYNDDNSSSNNNIIDMMKNNKLIPLPTLERSKVVEIPVFMCWKLSSTEETKYNEEGEHIDQEEETQSMERSVRLYDQNINESHIPIRDVLLRVYGSYGDCTDLCFHSERLTLLHRGFIVASAALRGGGEFGIDWRDAGRKLQRATTVNDLISVSQFINDYQHHHYEEVHLEECSGKEDKYESTCNLVHEWRDLKQNAPLTEIVEDEIKSKSKSKRYINKKVHLIISGDSAGGFVVLRAAVAAPALFHAVIAAVPFVDCLTTLLDESLPLTITEWEEFGNPLRDRVAYDNITMLSPYEAADDMMSMMNATAKKECNTNTEAHPYGCCGREHDTICKEATNNSKFTLPHIFMLTDWNDSRVGYWESLKLTAKLRSRFTAYRQAITIDDVVNASLPSCARRILLHHCELDEYDVNNNSGESNNGSKNNCSSHGSGSGGHCGPTGRYEELHELAREYAFALIVCGKC